MFSLEADSMSPSGTFAEKENFHAKQSLEEELPEDTVIVGKIFFPRLLNQNFYSQSTEDRVC